jgi:hypothetical protein
MPMKSEVFVYAKSCHGQERNSTKHHSKKSIGDLYGTPVIERTSSKFRNNPGNVKRGHKETNSKIRTGKPY